MDELRPCPSGGGGMKQQDCIIEHCELCGVELDADNCYGTNDFTLCRYHHEKFYDLLNFLLSPFLATERKE